MKQKFDADELMVLFDQLFKVSHQTILCRSESEPIYLPADAAFPLHRILFAYGFFSSALHEIAHWCIAGEKRRRLVDYGYWYKPDGRTAKEQDEFAKFEAKPQALEWIFSVAAGCDFYASADNLSGEASDMLMFRRSIRAQALCYLKAGLPARAAIFNDALLHLYARSEAWTSYWTRVKSDPMLIPL